MHAGGVYQPEASANRLFASDLFPVYINKQEFVQTCSQLIALSLELFLFPLPEISKNRSNRTWLTYIESMRSYATMDAHRATKLAAFCQAPMFRQSFVIHHSMFDMHRPTRATEPMKQSDFVRTAGKEMVYKFRELTAAAQSRASSTEQSVQSALAASSSAAMTATHEFVASTPY